MKKITLTETDLVDIINKIVKEDEELGGMTADPRIMKKEYDDTTPIRKITMDEVIKNLWQIQELLKECSPAIALSRLVILLEELGESTNYQEDINYPCDADGPNDISESKKNIDKLIKHFETTQEEKDGIIDMKEKIEFQFEEFELGGIDVWELLKSIKQIIKN